MTLVIFSSLIVDVYSGYDFIEFVPLSSLVSFKKQVVFYAVHRHGFLTLPGKERLIALDEQHRLLSLRIAIRGSMGLPGGGPHYFCYGRFETTSRVGGR